MLRRQFTGAALLLLLTACGGGGAAPTTDVLGPTAPQAPSGGTNPPPRQTATTTAAARSSATRTSAVGPVIPPSTGTVFTTTRTPIGTPRAVGSATPGVLPAAPPVIFGPAPWKPGDRSDYAVTTTDGQPAGTATFTLGGEFEAGTLSATLLVGGTQDRYQIGFDGRTFAPVSELRSIVAAQGTIDIRAEFRPGGATIEVIDRNGTTRNQLTLPQVYYANDQFLMILRALPFAQGYQGALQLVPSQGNPATLPTVVTVTGQETLTTPGGPLLCWRVEANYQDIASRQVLWYAVAGSRPLVKYDAGRYIYLLTQNR